jgi:LPS sulfotransferase NodH
MRESAPRSDRGESPIVSSCLVASTPWAGSWVVCAALGATGLVGEPRDYFNPLLAVARSEQWGLLGSGKDFASGYLSAAAKSAVGPNGVLSVNLPWSHQRWLTRMARAASRDAAGAAVRTDAEVVEAWLPGTRYVYLTSGDTAWQAARWYQERPPTAATGGSSLPPDRGHSVDFQQVRWMEALIWRQQRAWESYFLAHDIQACRVEFQTFLARPMETVSSILAWLGLPGMPARVRDWDLYPHRAIESPDWLPGYLDQRDRLGVTIGVRGAEAE